MAEIKGRVISVDTGPAGSTDESAWGRQAVSGLRNYAAGFGELGAAVGLPTEDWAEEQRYMGGVAANRARELGIPQTWDESQGVGGVAKYIGKLGVESAPYIGEAAFGGLGGRLLLAPRMASRGIDAARAAATANQYLRPPLTAGETAAIAERANRIASGAGVIAGSYPSSVGDILGNQRDETGTTNPAAAFALGLPYAAANVAPGLESLAGGVYKGAGRGIGSRALRGLVGGVAAAPGEAANEAFQEVMNQAGRVAVNPDAQMWGPEALERYKESAIGGALLGQTVGSAVGLMSRNPAKPQSLLPDANPEPKPTPPAATSPPSTFVPPTVAPTGTFTPTGTVAPQPSVAAPAAPAAPAVSPVAPPAPVEPAVDEAKVRARMALFDKYGEPEQVVVDGQPVGFKLPWAEKRFNDKASIDRVVDTLAAREAAKGPLQQQVEKAYLDASREVGAKVPTPDTISKQIANYLTGATDIAGVAARIKADIEPLTKRRIKADEQVKLDRLQVFYQNLTGQESGLMQLQTETPAAATAPAPTTTAAPLTAEELLRKVIVETIGPNTKDAQTRAGLILKAFGEQLSRKEEGAAAGVTGQRIGQIIGEAQNPDGSIKPEFAQGMLAASRRMGVNLESVMQQLAAERAAVAVEAPGETISEAEAQARPAAKLEEETRVGIEDTGSMEEGADTQTMGVIETIGGSQGATVGRGDLAEQWAKAKEAGDTAAVGMIESVMPAYEAVQQRGDDKRAGEIERRVAKWVKDKNTTDQAFLDKLAAMYAKKEGKTDAVQKRSTKKVDVRQRSEDGETVGEGNAEGQAPAEGKQAGKKASRKGKVSGTETVEAQQAETQGQEERLLTGKKEPEVKKYSREELAESWDSFRQYAPDAPAWADLPEAARERWYDVASTGPSLKQLVAITEQLTDREAAGEWFPSTDEEIAEHITTLRNTDPNAQWTRVLKLDKTGGIYDAMVDLSNLDLYHVLGWIDVVTVLPGEAYARLRGVGTAESSSAFVRTFVDGTIGLVYNRDALTSAAKARFVTLHELGHVMDVVGRGGIYSRDSVLSFDPAAAKNTIPNPDGAISKKAKALFAGLHLIEGWTTAKTREERMLALLRSMKDETLDQKNDWLFLSYPLGRKDLGPAGMAQELFAQLFGAYVVIPSKMKKQFPEAAEFIERVIKHAKNVTQIPRTRDEVRQEARRFSPRDALPPGIAKILAEQKAKLATENDRGNDAAGMDRRSATGFRNTDRDAVDITPGERRVKPSADVGRLAKLLGPQLYGSPTEMASVTLKELFQNAFDASKRDGGVIKIKIDPDDRTITVEDNGHGMTPETVEKSFLRLAGTEKETDRSSGGLGIAKMQFLFGAEKIEVNTVRGGMETKLSTSGAELINTLDNPDQGVDLVTTKTTRGSGTTVKVTIPRFFVDPATGEQKEIRFSQYSLEDAVVLKHSPLFENVTVYVNGRKLDIGNEFPSDKYTTFATVKFDWGTARIIVEKEQRDAYGNNVHILSNGLWQFSEKLLKDPKDTWGDLIPRQFYINLEPTVKPDQAGYPIALNRQGFSPSVGPSFQNIYKYLWLKYRETDMSAMVEGYGSIADIKPDGMLSFKRKLAPKQTQSDTPTGLGIDAQDKVEVRDGRLYVNNRVVPELSPDELEKYRIDIAKFKLPPGEVDPSVPFVHDGLVYKEGTANAGKSFIDVMYEKHGQRFGKYMYQVGIVFKDLRDALAANQSWNAMRNTPVGVFFGSEPGPGKSEYGVNFRIPFEGILVNPGITDMDDIPGMLGKALSLYQTMVHELAHERERSHGADFVNELQKMLAWHEAQSTNNASEFKRRLRLIMETYGDLYTNLNSELRKTDLAPRGARIEGVGQTRDAIGVQDFPSVGEGPELDGPSVGVGTGEGGGSGRGGAGRGQAAAANPPRRSVTSTLPPAAQKASTAIWENVKEFAKQKLYGFAFTHDLADMAKSLPAAKTFLRLMGEKGANKNEIMTSVQEVLQKAYKLNRQQQHEVNMFLRDSTVTQMWGYTPSWRTIDAKKELDPDLEARWEKLTPEQQEIIDKVFRHGDQMIKRIQKAVVETVAAEKQREIEAAQKNPKRQAELPKLIAERDAAVKDAGEQWNQLKGPYAPLKRFGAYAVTGKSRAYLDATASAREKMKSDPTHYWVQFFASKGEAEIEKQRLTALFPNGEVEAFERETREDELAGSNRAMLQKIRHLAMFDEDALGDTDEEMKAARLAVARTVSELYLNAVAESSARQSSRPRRFVGGYDADMLKSFAFHGRATAHFVSALENNDKVIASIAEMREAAHKPSSDELGPKDDRMRLFNEFVRRYHASYSDVDTDWQNKFLQFTSVWMLLTSPAYFLQNMTQTFMLTVPMLNSRFGIGASWGAITSALGDVRRLIKASRGQMGISIESHANEVERQMLHDLRVQGILDIGMERDFGDAEYAVTGLSRAWQQANRLMYNATRNVEIVNRVSSALAAYRLAYAQEIQQNKTAAEAHAAATTYAGNVVRQTHGDYSDFNAPRYFRQGAMKGLPIRMMTQFRKFQIIQLSLVARSIHNAFMSADPEVKAIGRAQVGWILAHHGVMAGALGSPVVSLAAQLIAAVFGDEGEDDETYLRRVIGNKTISDLLLRGVPAAAGVNVSERIGMGQMLSLFPYLRSGPLDGRAGYYETLAAFIGPSAAVGARFADGAQRIREGDYYRGLGAMLPSGLTNAMRGFALATEGLRDRKGDVLLRPEDLSYADVMFQAVGLPTTAVTDAYRVKRVLTDTEAYFSRESTQLKRAYAEAHRDRDSAGMAEVRAKWTALQNERIARGFARQPMSQLLRTDTQRQKREGKTIAGVPYNKSNKEAVRQLTMQ